MIAEKSVFYWRFRNLRKESSIFQLGAESSVFNKSRLLKNSIYTENPNQEISRGTFLLKDIFIRFFLRLVKEILILFFCEIQFN